MTLLSHNDNGPAPVVETAKNIVSLVATSIGLVILLIGLKHDTFVKSQKARSCDV